jgi:hypothetical protein
MSEVTVTVVDGDTPTRIGNFLDAFIDAPGSAALIIQGGHDEDGTPAMVIILGGVTHAFTTDEARMVADVAESCMRKFRDSAGMWANLAMSLREYSKRIDDEHRTKGAAVE